VPGGLSCNAGFCELPGAVIVDASIDAMPSLNAPSCVGLAATCGASGNDSCCTSLAMPGGTYYRSHDKAGNAGSDDMDFPATLSGFRLDKYEVTVGRFRSFVNAGMGTQASPPTAGTGPPVSLPLIHSEATWRTRPPGQARDQRPRSVCASL
jgi:formylglycine-generating enzyme